MNSFSRGALAGASWLQKFTVLVIAALTGMLLCTAVVMLGAAAVYGVEVLQQPELMRGGNPEYLPYVRALQVGYTLGAFLVPGWVGYRLFQPHGSSWFRMSDSFSVLVLLTAGIALFSMPVTQGLGYLNQQLELPEFLSGWQHWIERQESQVEGLVRTFLQMESTGDLLLNLFMIALLPAVSEELLFRGVIQKELRKRLSIHAAIWITAALFSAIHMQFLGFLPRMFLGGMLGYLAYWGGSLWYPIIAHFLNNGLAVYLVYRMGTEALEQSNPETPIEGIALLPGLVIGTLLTIGLFWLFKRVGYAQKKEA